MPKWAYYLGILCITYFISRIYGFVFAGLKVSSKMRLVAVYSATAFTIVILIMLLRDSDPVTAFPYLAVLGIWLLIDLARTVKSLARRGRVNPLHWRYLPRTMAIVMVILSVVYVGRTFSQFQYESGSYADVVMKSSASDALYSVGRPDRVRNDGGEINRTAGNPTAFSEWHFAAPRMVIRFDGPGGGVSSVLCSGGDGPAVVSCYKTLSLGVGAAEVAMRDRLGAPTSELVESGRKIARYPEIGHDFVLSRFRIQAVKVYPDDGSTLARFWRLIRFAIP